MYFSLFISTGIFWGNLLIKSFYNIKKENYHTSNSVSIIVLLSFILKRIFAIQSIRIKILCRNQELFVIFCIISIFHIISFICIKFFNIEFFLFRKFRNHIPFVRKCHGVLAIGVVPGICLISVVSAILFPPPESFICEKINEEMARDMALWNYQSNLVLLSSRFLNVERKKDCITVKYYCETNMGPAVYKAFCNNYGGYVKAECSLLNRHAP